jgi:hypothetical protein
VGSRLIQRNGSRRRTVLLRTPDKPFGGKHQTTPDEDLNARHQCPVPERMNFLARLDRSATNAATTGISRGDESSARLRQAILFGTSFDTRVCHSPDGGARKEADRGSNHQRARWMPANDLAKAAGHPAQVMLLDV